MIKKIVVPKAEPCLHISGGEYDAYIQRTLTRRLGGISPTFRAHLIRKIFPYKLFLPLNDNPRDSKAREIMEAVQTADKMSSSVPSDGNEDSREEKWTPSEKKYYDKTIRAFARWEVNPFECWVRSLNCQNTTKNSDGLCEHCKELKADSSFREAVRRVSRFPVYLFNIP